ncbi:hypothetical protein HPB49_007659 [Dermacentor silvarum]|uniref:Uncharacterized protein n=1 Tax=Dermacentor silvarum TaxID=543639 RepID=A0ACB8CDY7_DERSI|nr:hypothetical protein HPB49_007659 [Dermacentor silvarum]
MPYEVTGRETAPSEVSLSNGWSDIAPRRTTKPNLYVAASVAAYGARTKASKPVSARKEIIKASRMPLLPQNETKVVIRIRGGLNIAKTGHVEIVQAIQEAAGLETTQCDGDTICPNLKQNIMVLMPYGQRRRTARAQRTLQIQRELGIPIGQQRSQEPLAHTRDPRPLHLGGALRTPGRSQQLGPASQGDNGMPGLRNGGDAAHKPRAAEGPISEKKEEGTSERAAAATRADRKRAEETSWKQSREGYPSVSLGSRVTGRKPPNRGPARVPCLAGS